MSDFTQTINEMIQKYKVDNVPTTDDVVDTHDVIDNETDVVSDNASDNESSDSHIELETTNYYFEDSPNPIDSSSDTDDIPSDNIKSKLLHEFDREDDIAKDSEEILLNEDNNRLVLKPINPQFRPIWKLYKTQEAAHWTAESVDISKDKYDFEKLDPNIQEFIKMVLAFFAGADTIVNINIAENFSRIQVKEAIVMYDFQTMMENVHSEVYSDMLTGIISDTNERNVLVNAFKNVASIKRMFEWAEEWTNSDRRIGFSIMAFTIFEGLFFSSAFASIYWLKNHIGKNEMQGFIKSNEYIARDEGLHTNGGCMVYSYVKHKLSKDEAKLMMDEAVNIAKQFNKDAIKVKLIGMNESIMSDYIEYVADRLMVYLGYEKIYNTEIPAALSFMKNIGINNKNNFFEGRTTDYQKARTADNADHEFKILSEY
jgi:ribonucleoside-diphosphate reductase subunit M2